MSTGSASDPRWATRRRPALRDAAAPAALPWARGLGMRLAPLVQADDLGELMTRLVRLGEEIAQAEGGFLLLVDAHTREPDFSTARNAQGGPVRPALLRPLFASAGVLARLSHGVHVPASASEAETEATLLLPLVHDSSLRAVLGVAVPAGKPLARVVEPLRDLAQQGAPLLARLREIEELRAQVAGLTRLVQEGARHETRAAELEHEVKAARLEGVLKGHLLAHVNHALRTPLVAIRGYTRLLLEPDGAKDAAQRHQYLEVVARNAERLVDAAANLMVPTRRLNLVTLDLRAFWREALAAARPAAEVRRIALAEKCPDQPVSLVGDADDLRRLLNELVAAALEMSAADDELCAELIDEARRVVITVSTDEGTRKTDTSSSSRAAPGGRSLRLDTVREIANLHGGRFAVASNGAARRDYSVVLPRVALEP